MFKYIIIIVIAGSLPQKSLAQPGRGDLFNFFISSDTIIRTPHSLTARMYPGGDVGIVGDSLCYYGGANLSSATLAKLRADSFFYTDKNTGAKLIRKCILVFKIGGKTKEFVLFNVQERRTFFLGPLNMKKKKEKISIPPKIYNQKEKSIPGSCPYPALDIRKFRKSI